MADKLSEQQIIEYREAFSVYDKDGDGIIAIKELFKVMWSLGQNPTEKEMEKILQDVDPDSEGSIDFADFLAVMAKRQKDTEQEEELRAAFRAFDMDHNGTIDTKELRSVMTDLCDDITNEDIDEMFYHFDKDGDGMISYEEFISVVMAAEKEKDGQP
ncbi:calmodulin-alpha-like [Branchiostoma floridae]|uniref:Calmodulin-alpha-like n=1 Tax=Branchiostoma floridae TaxID=7739 RepID=A0A9J7LSJ9_BRAFL|nr:calmodulin-alpha-like [Branchiostoma floridae]XP_035687804.1 calmodulin-alpha-like [Branchiostoma floridae]XP_035687806.1 calmodulin-alpha-like [Branchiostoma floridae]XP_035687807.1 calmodulin-alpha-like [Branchiostoma floridae]